MYFPGVIFSSFIFSFLHVATSTHTCRTASCGDGEPVIRFPFWIETRQPLSCGYPGFHLSCDDSRQTILQLPPAGKFSVQTIDYGTQEIWINDPNNCLPGRILLLNLSDSPFRGGYHKNFSFFNCLQDYHLNYRLNLIACLSGPNYKVFAASSPTAISSKVELSCRFIATVAVPVDWLYDEQMLSWGLSDGLRLSWDEPNCGNCTCKIPTQTGQVPTDIRYTHTRCSALLPKPDDNGCPIRLSEYRPKETLKTIPQCHHCFHADCIDEWLRLNASCPLCRNSTLP